MAQIGTRKSVLEHHAGLEEFRTNLANQQAQGFQAEEGRCVFLLEVQLGLYIYPRAQAKYSIISGTFFISDNAKTISKACLQCIGRSSCRNTYSKEKCVYHTQSGSSNGGSKERAGLRLAPARTQECLTVLVRDTPFAT